MNSRRIVFGMWVCAMGGLLVAPDLASAQTIATGSSSAVDGYLSIGPDEYGSWTSAGFGGVGDIFNPAGPAAALEAGFTSGFFLFQGGTHRELLSDVRNWQAVYPVDPSLSRAITVGNQFFDTTGNGVNDTVTSAFDVTGAPVNLAFDLRQHVATFGAGVSFLQQDYTIVNMGGGPLSFSMVRTFDGDLLWSASFENDEVGTSMHGAGLGPYVFEQEASLPGTTAITLSSLQGGEYYGGKHGLDPLGAGLPFNFGTDVQVWDAFGIPGNWRDFIAGVGAGVNGVSGEFPSGSTPPEDGFVGLDFNINLEPGQSTTITVFHTFGQNVPVPEPSALSLLALGGLLLLRRRR